MQIHFALSEPPRWDGDERLGKTAIVHLTPGLDGVSRAVNEAERGLLPAEATVVVGQPLTMDSSRAPDGAGLLWIQLQELPWHVKGDAAGELDPGDGTWTEELRERYADRIQARIARHVPNLESALRKRVTLSPADLQAANVNLHHGDPYSGSLAARPEPALAPVPGQPGALDAGRAASGTSARAPIPGPGARRGLAERWSQQTAARAQAAAPGEALDLGDHDREPVVRGRPRRLPAAGADGIGIWEMKLGDDSLERFRASGLARRRSRSGRALDPAAAADGGPCRSGRADRGDPGRRPAARSLRARVRALSHRPGRRPRDHRRGNPRDRRGGAAPRACRSRSSRPSASSHTSGRSPAPWPRPKT